jgi:hypothetical protein
MMDVVLERHNPCDERSPMLDEWSGHIFEKEVCWMRRYLIENFSLECSWNVVAWRISPWSVVDGASSNSFSLGENRGCADIRRSIERLL